MTTVIRALRKEALQVIHAVFEDSCDKNGRFTTLCGKSIKVTHVDQIQEPEDVSCKKCRKRYAQRNM